MSYSLIAQGSFTSTGVAVDIDLPASADYFVVKNLTQLANTDTPGRGVQFEWYRGQTADDAAVEWKKADGANDLQLVAVSSGGFKYRTSIPDPEAAVSGSAITAASPAVVTMTNSFSDGDIVRLYNTTGMLQISGMEFEVANATGSDFDLLGLDASGFAAAATNVVARRLPDQKGVAPQFQYVTAISQASEAEVTVSKQHNFQLGQLVHFSVPEDMGMVQMDQLTGKVTAVTGTDSPVGSGVYKFKVDIDSTNFSAFAFPASTASPTASLFATVQPAGQKNSYNVSQVPFRSEPFLPFMRLAAGAQSPAGSNNDVIVWQAYKMA